MSRHIVKIWNQIVSEEDILYCLGDWSFAGIDNIKNFRNQLRCQTIHLVLGNHDDHIRKNKIITSTDNIGNNYVQVQSLFSSVNEALTVKHGKHMFYLNHYAHRVWYGSHKGCIHLYGHSHDSLDKNNQFWGKSMDCGIDSAYRILGEYRPFSIEEVISIMDKRDIRFVDAHDKETNIQ